jgi:ubiquinone/menaquinone biosynthesis C-methylase UbiE
MRFWHDQVVPRLVDVALGVGGVHELRARVCEGLTGEVLEIGFGSGLNTEHLPPEVRRVSAVEPSDVAWEIARHKHLGDGHPPVVRAGLDGERLELPDCSVDAALSTFTLCTIPHVEAALAQVHRVLRPGAGFHFLEHGLAPDPGVRRWQHRLAPIQYHLFAGCHLDRPISDLVAGSGLQVEELDTFYFRGPKTVGSFYLGRAVKS